jgi:hypothetical protein
MRCFLDSFFFLEDLLESPPVSAVPLKTAGGPVHAYDIFGDVGFF